jgi:hypothetical protein
MSAAIRARWIKRYKAIPCSTLLIENSYLGGLASWQGCLFTGPSWRMKGNDIVRRLLKDLERLQIKVQQGRVTRIGLRGEAIEVFTSDGEVLRSLAVIIATGIKVLVNERDYLGRGLEMTSMGYEFIVAHLKRLLSRSWEPRLVIVGSPKLQNMIPLIKELNTTRSPLSFIVEGEGEGDEGIAQGWVERYWGDGYLQGVTLQTPKGPLDISCAGVLLDFNSYELSPTSRIEVNSEKLGTPFIRVDQDMQTSIPGVLAAGDVTQGGYNSFSRAVAQGMTAGLSAYRYVYQRKFGCEPPLFAYRPRDFPLSLHFQELPPLDEELRPKALVKGEEIKASLGEKWAWLTDRLHGRSSIREIARETGTKLEDLKEVLRRLVGRKMITFHIEVDL